MAKRITEPAVMHFGDMSYFRTCMCKYCEAHRFVKNWEVACNDLFTARMFVGRVERRAERLTDNSVESYPERFLLGIKEELADMEKAAKFEPAPET